MSKENTTKSLYELVWGSEDAHELGIQDHLLTTAQKELGDMNAKILQLEQRNMILQEKLETMQDMYSGLMKEYDNYIEEHP